MWPTYSTTEMNEFFREVARHINPAQRICDIGPGIRPQPFYRADFHLCIEPHEEYANWLKDKGYPVLLGTAQEWLSGIDPVGVIYMLDVIEHMEKNEGKFVLEIARQKAQQVVVFTPLGFHEQSYKEGDKDAWGMNGTHWQTHRSGWTPDDFPDAAIYADPKFHGDYGAFFALLQS